MQLTIIEGSLIAEITRRNDTQVNELKQIISYFTSYKKCKGDLTRRDFSLVGLTVPWGEVTFTSYKECTGDLTRRDFFLVGLTTPWGEVDLQNKPPWNYRLS